MTRLFIGLTLLLASFLSALDSLDWLHQMAARAGLHRWMTELALASAAVAIFVKASDLHRRLLFPRRGLRLLAAGIVVYAVAMAAATGQFVTAVGMLPLEEGSVWSQVPALLAGMYPQPVFLAAQMLLMLGAFRALSNLVPHHEFKEDF